MDAFGRLRCLYGLGERERGRQSGGNVKQTPHHYFIYFFECIRTIICGILYAHKRMIYIDMQWAMHMQLKNINLFGRWFAMLPDTGCLVVLSVSFAQTSECESRCFQRFIPILWFASRCYVKPNNRYFPYQVSFHSFINLMNLRSPGKKKIGKIRFPSSTTAAPLDFNQLRSKKR